MPNDPASPLPPATLWRTLGEVVAILSVAPGYKFFTLADLDWMVLPPLVAKQARLAHQGDRPIGVVLWAMLDNETAAQMLDPRFRLRPDQWTSGPNPWVTDLVHLGGPNSDLESAMLNDVRAQLPNTPPLRIRPIELLNKLQPENKTNEK
jgi:hemolysin-activating ACP:hemolysin acyltransferase